MTPKTAPPTCDACYFRCHGLCALRLEEACPTFRPATRQGLVPPRQAPLLAVTQQPVLAPA